MKTPKVTTSKTPLVHKCALCPFSTKFLSSYKTHVSTHSSEKPFKCPECPYRAKFDKYVKEHFKNIHLLEPLSSRPFPCSESGCHFAAKHKSELTRHSKIHSDEAPEFSCSHPNCNYSTSFRASLIVHKRIHTGEKPFVCQFESCSYATANSSALVKHSRIHTKEKPYKCHEPNCKYSATNCSTLKRHQLTHEPKEGEERPSFKCPLCEYKGKGKAHVSAHIKTHTLEKLFKCDEPNCNFEAKTKAHLQLHKVVHSDEKPFVCSFESCEFRCKIKINLSHHLRIHSEERRYKCELCPFRGKTRGVVEDHIEYVHSDPNFRPFKCTEPKCDYASKKKANLHKHLLIHKGYKKYSCSFPMCSYKAIVKQKVKRHENTFHVNKYKCELCGFGAKTKGIFNSHKETHTNEKSAIGKKMDVNVEQRV